MKKAQIVSVVGLIVLAGVLMVMTTKRAAVPVAPTPQAGPQTLTQTMTQAPGPLHRTDESGNTWLLDVTAAPMLTSVDPNSPKAGPPIVVKTDVHRVNDREASIGLILAGQAGERYRPVVRKNGSTVSAPKLRIVNEAGQVILDDSFRYG